MKNLNIILICVLGVLSLVSCNDDRGNNPRYENPTEFVLNTPKYAEGYYDLKNTESVQLTWSQPDYGFAAAADYYVQVSTDGKFEGETFDEAGQTCATKFNLCNIDLKSHEFAMAICNALKIVGEADVPTEAIPVYVRIKALIPQIEGSTIYSNVVELKNVKCYYALPDIVLPTKMFMIGNFCDWNWNNAASMIPIHSNPDRFWVIRYVKAGEGFKFNIEKDWTDNAFGFEKITIAKSAAGEVTADGDGNIVIEKSGWYIFATKTAISGRDLVHSLEILEPNVYVYGAANGGIWNNDPAWKFNVIDDPDAEFPFVSPTVLATDGSDGDHCLRLCIHPDEWDGIDWWKTEFIYFGGKISYRADGPDQDRVSNPAGKVYLNFVTGAVDCK